MTQLRTYGSGLAGRPTLLSVIVHVCYRQLDQQESDEASGDWGKPHVSRGLHSLQCLLEQQGTSIWVIQEVSGEHWQQHPSAHDWGADNRRHYWTSRVQTRKSMWRSGQPGFMKGKCLTKLIAFSGGVTGFVVDGRAVHVVYFNGYSMGCNKILGARLGIFPISLII